MFAMAIEARIAGYSGPVSGLVTNLIYVRSPSWRSRQPAPWAWIGPCHFSSASATF